MGNTLRTSSDEQLLDAYFEGDLHACRTFYHRHSGRVMAYAIKHQLTNEGAADVCQEAFLRLHKSIHKYERGRPALPWFFSIVHHCVMDAKRLEAKAHKIQGTIDVAAMMYTPGIERASQMSTHDPYDLLEQLPEKQQTIVKLRALEGLSFAEIEKATGQNQVSLRKIFERARTKLKTLLNEGPSDAA